MSNKISKRGHKWALDFTNRRKPNSQVASSTDNSVAPVGFLNHELSEQAHDRENNPDLIVKKSWEIAMGPLKQIPMNLFIMWMAGNSISIFPIMMVGMMFVRPAQALIASQQTFKVIEGDQALLQRIVYVVGNVVCLGLAVYKCQVMGLLPTQPSDWLAFVEPQKRLEWSGGGVSLS